MTLVRGTSAAGRGVPPCGGSGRPTWGAALLLLGVAVVSQGVHDVAIEHLGIPYPTLVSPPEWLPVLGDAVRLSFLVMFCLAARSVLDDMPLFRAAALVGLLAIFLSETVRLAVIQMFLANDWSVHVWLFNIVDMASRAVPWAILGASAVVLSKSHGRDNGLARTVALVIVVSLLTRLVAVALAKSGSASLLASIGVERPDEFFRPPYGPGMLTVIYATFLEPTLAAYVMAGMCWRGLPNRISSRTTIFTLLVLGASGRITLLLVNSFWVRQPAALAILATGQFFAETLVMAFLVARLHRRTFLELNARPAK